MDMYHNYVYFNFHTILSLSIKHVHYKAKLEMISISLQSNIHTVTLLLRSLIGINIAKTGNSKDIVM